MRNQKTPISVLAILIASGMLSTVSAEEFFYWVDENGVANFSQWAPAEPVDNVVREQLPASQEPEFNPDEDLYAVEATQQSIQALRDEMQKRREDARERQNSNQPTIIYQPVEASPDPYWYPGCRPRPPRPVPSPGENQRPQPRPVPPVTWNDPGG